MKAFKYFTLSFHFPSFTQRERESNNALTGNLGVSDYLNFTVSIVIEMLIVFYLRDKK